MLTSGGILGRMRFDFLSVVDEVSSGVQAACVDWYLRLDKVSLQSVVNETCSWLVVDAQGLPDLKAGLAIGVRPSPSEARWQQVRQLAFGGPASDHKLKGFS